MKVQEQRPKLQDLLIEMWALTCIKRKYLIKHVLHQVFIINSLPSTVPLMAPGVFRSAVELTISQEGGSSFGHSLFS